MILIQSFLTRALYDAGFWTYILYGYLNIYTCIWKKGVKAHEFQLSEVDDTSPFTCCCFFHNITTNTLCNQVQFLKKCRVLARSHRKRAGGTLKKDFCACYSCSYFSSMIIFITSETNITDYQFNLTSWLLFFHWKRQKKYISHVRLYLQTFDFLL